MPLFTHEQAILQPKKRYLDETSIRIFEIFGEYKTTAEIVYQMWETLPPVLMHTVKKVARLNEGPFINALLDILSMRKAHIELFSQYATTRKVAPTLARIQVSKRITKSTNSRKYKFHGLSTSIEMNYIEAQLIRNLTEEQLIFMASLAMNA